MHEKLCVITGGNSGIGREAAIELARMGMRVAIVSRDRGRGEAALAEIRRRAATDSATLYVADLSSQTEIRRLAAELSALPRIDVLVNNAGLILGTRRLTTDGIETTFAVNHLGYFLLTALLLDTLRASAPARVVSVASEAHRSGRIDFDDLQGERSYAGWRAYAQSKLANILFTYELARRLEGSGVTANCLHPGVIASNFGASGSLPVRVFFKLFGPLLTSPAKGAATSVHLAASPEVDGVSGAYFVAKRPARSSPASYDEATAARLWEVSERLTHLERDA